MISNQQTEYTAGSGMGQPREVELSDDQRAVIDFVRTYHDEHGFIQDPHRLMAALSKRFASQGGKRYLYKLFPRGPVLQACLLGGVQVPENCLDRSFGTAF